MNRLRRKLVIAGSALPVLADAGWSGAAASAKPKALGYLPWWMADGWREMPLGQLDRIVLFEIVVRADGSVDENDWERRSRAIVEFARTQQTPVDIAFALHGETSFNELFLHAEARARLSAACLRWLDQGTINGLHLDIEGYAPANVDALNLFREWLGRLAEQGRKAGKSLSAFFPADDHFTPYDAASASLIDFWVAQIYDAHSVDAERTGPLVTRARDNPVALPRALHRLTALNVRRGSVLLSVPLYGFEWPAVSDQVGARTSGRGRLLTYAQTPAHLMPDDRKVATERAQRYGLKRDSEQTPYYVYADGAAWMQGWYEDMHSLTHKLAPERGRGYGLAFFPLGYDRNAIVEPLLRWWRARL